MLWFKSKKEKNKSETTEPSYISKNRELYISITSNINSELPSWYNVEFDVNSYDEYVMTRPSWFSIYKDGVLYEFCETPSKLYKAVSNIKKNINHKKKNIYGKCKLSLRVKRKCILKK